MIRDIFSGSLSLLGFLIAILTALRADIGEVNTLLLTTFGVVNNDKYFMYVLAFATCLCSMCAFLCFMPRMIESFCGSTRFEKTVAVGFAVVLITTTIYPVILIM